MEQRRKKVVFLFQGQAHYYNYVLSRLNAMPGVEVVVVFPQVVTGVGAGVYQTEKGADFRCIRLDEFCGRNAYEKRFKRLSRVILREKPDCLVVSDAHLASLYRNPFLFLLVKVLRIKIILKSIPFRVPLYADLCQAELQRLREGIKRPSPRFVGLTNPMESSRLAAVRQLGRWLTSGLNAVRWLKGRFNIALLLAEQRFFYQFPDGHVNYVEDAYRVLSSYGVPAERVFVTYNSPDTDMLAAARTSLLQDAGIAVRPHRIIHVGRLVEWKRVDLLLEAFRKIKREIHDAELLVVGAGPERDRLERLASEYGVNESVSFCGGVYDPLSLGRLYLSSSVYVLAGMGGLSINEAMCFGLPVVCSVCDGTEKHLVVDGQNGFFFKDGDAGSLAEKIEAIISDPALRENMGRNSLSIINEKINIRVVVDRYMKAFSALGIVCEAGPGVRGRV